MWLKNTNMNGVNGHRFKEWTKKNTESCHFVGPKKRRTSEASGEPNGREPVNGVQAMPLMGFAETDMDEN
jgi:hypothetical protein